MILPSFDAVWLLLCLPFASATVIACVPPLRNLTNTHLEVTWPLGLVGLGCFIAGVLGLCAPPYRPAMTLCGGAISGFVMFFRAPKTDGNGGDDGGGGPPPDDPPPPPGQGRPIDWQLFDRLREQWEATPVSRR